MKINGQSQDLQSLKDAYMKARNNNDTREMNRLKAEAMKLMASEEENGELREKSKPKVDEGIQVNADGDILDLKSTNRVKKQGEQDVE